jgi:hypothetical protein
MRTDSKRVVRSAMDTRSITRSRICPTSRNQSGPSWSTNPWRSTANTSYIFENGFSHTIS